MRPRTLAEVARRARDGDSFDHCLANFLDHFYAAPDALALAEAPPLLTREKGDLGQVQDAYLAAVAEELTRVYQLAVPDWTAGESRQLRQPWFASPLHSLRAVLLLESPPAFRARNLFVSENALTRA